MSWFAPSDHVIANMDKLKPNDPRYQRKTADINGHRWGYLDAVPEGTAKGVVVLIHGFPDLSFGWRYQIPLLLELKFRCIALDSMGYGNTGDSPNLRDYGLKNHADAVAGIAKSLGIERVILGGHDWGGAVVWRVAQYYPDLVSHVFSVCTPYMPTSDTWVPLEQLAQKLPHFTYQLQFASEDQKVEQVVKDATTMRKFLNGLYGARPSSGRAIMRPEYGVYLDVIKEDDVGQSPLFNKEEIDYYVEEFLKNGIHGPLNWYRTRKINHEDEQSLPKEVKNFVKQPSLYVFATGDAVLKRELSDGMEKAVPNLTRGEVPAGHWALWETPKETNALIEEWFNGVVIGGKIKL